MVESATRSGPSSGPPHQSEMPDVCLGPGTGRAHVKTPTCADPAKLETPAAPRRLSVPVHWTTTTLARCGPCVPCHAFGKATSLPAQLSRRPGCLAREILVNSLREPGTGHGPGSTQPTPSVNPDQDSIHAPKERQVRPTAASTPPFLRRGRRADLVRAIRPSVGRPPSTTLSSSQLRERSAAGCLSRAGHDCHGQPLVG
ncbi:hypothetical protein CDD83_7183 [Cordyceps sp. RAO-2017]|nr:hypothetical protein CDD83_7183 [Cordyceps sp. RAO-2017]